MITKTLASKLLLALYGQSQSQGFTFPGFLVRIFLYSSVLTTLLLPLANFDSSCFFCVRYDTPSKRETEGKTYAGVINRAQQAYYLENGKFTFDFPELDLGMPQDTGNYGLRILVPMNQQEIGLQNDLQQVVTIAQAKEENLSSYLGYVVDIFDASSGAEKPQPVAILCEIKPDQPLPTTMPKIVGGKLNCPQGYELIVSN